MKQRKNIWMLAAMIIAASATCYFFRGILRDPAHLVHELGGDGIKNYFTYIYHSMYGQGWWFSGMNYPYGEHIMFVDGQPALTVTLSWLRQWWHFTPENLNLILNFMMVSAFFLAIIYVYKLLVKFKMPHLWAMAYAPLIIALSMQNFRVFGLYGLSYACVVPMMFYWFVCYYETNQKKYMVYLFLLAGIVMFLHPYQFALILMWSALYIAGYWLMKSSSLKAKLLHVLPVAIVLIAGFVLLKSVLKFTDPLTDRPEYPHGQMVSGTILTDIVASFDSPFGSWLHSKGIFTDKYCRNARSFAYIGVVPFLVISFSVIALMVRLLRRKRDAIGFLLGGDHCVWWFIAICALLLAMGVPFIWDMEWVLDYLSSWRQFRSLDWFALLFYYIVTIMSVAIIYRIAAGITDRRKWLRVVIIIIPFAIWAFEVLGISKIFHERSSPGNYNYGFFNSHQEKNWATFLNEHNLSGADFQAILYMPYYHVGSEKIWLSRAGWGFCVSLKTAFQLQLPMADANMSRSSWRQTFEQVKIGAGPYAYKSLLHEAEDNRPYLLMYMEGEELTPDERYLFQFADSIGINSSMVAYALHPARLAALEKQEWHKIKTDTRTDTPYYYESFAGSLNKQTIFGQGSQMAVIGKDTVIASIDVSNWPTDKMYEASAWFFVNNKDYHTPFLMLKCLDTAGVQLNQINLLCSEANDTHDMWFRPSKYFTLPAGTGQVSLSLNVTSDVLWYRLDEVMIRAAEDTIIMKDGDGRIMVNNHLLPQ